MPNKYSDGIVYSHPVEAPYTSRYRLLNLITDEISNQEYVETYEEVLFPERQDDTYFVVTPKEENRLDLISHRHYGTTLFWWVIAEASGIENPFYVPVGATLRIPSRATIMNRKGDQT